MAWMLKTKTLRNTRSSLFGNVNEVSRMPTGNITDTHIPKKHGNSSDTSIRSWEYPNRYFRHYNNVGYAASQGGEPEQFDALGSYAQDTSFIVQAGLA